MSYLVIARKWRPGSFGDVVGQEHVTRTLVNAIKSERVAHAYLFTGARGVGKTSAARILAKALNCEKGPTTEPCNRCTICKEISGGTSVDVHEIDGASNTSVDDIRELKEGINYLPSSCRKKIYIIDEVHMLSTSAFNALLKTLEEPPDHVIFIFATTEPHKIPGTVMSRCQRFDFKRIPVKLIFERLKHIIEEEGVKISDKGLMIIAREADGGMRDAQSLLDQVISFSEDEISDDDVVDVLGVIDRTLIHETAMAVLKRDSRTCLDVVDRMFVYGWDVKEFGQELLEYFRNLAVVKATDGEPALVECSDDELALMKNSVEDLTQGDLHLFFDMMARGMEEVSRSLHPKISLEMLLLKMSTLGSLRNIDELISAVSSAPQGRVPEVPRHRNYAVDLKKKNVEKVAVESPSEPYTVPESPKKEDRKDWKGFVAFVRGKKGPLGATFGAILEHAHLINLDDSNIVFAPENDFSREKVEDELKTLTDFSREYFGNEKTIKVQQLEEKVEVVNSVYEDRKKKESDRSRKLKKEAESHPMVTASLEIFNGEIKEIKADISFNE